MMMMNLFYCPLLSICSTAGPDNEDDDDDAKDDDGMYRENIKRRLVKLIPSIITGDVIDHIDKVRNTIHIIIAITLRQSYKEKLVVVVLVVVVVVVVVIIVV